ncbi:MAG: hypothetical protein M0Z71_04690 [Nitrospiraceae bacterium]|nr:hypothetical protein [Nitrospiraceae bacterium]
MSEKREFKYTIGGKTYMQRPLVLGQIMQLMALLKGLVIPKGIGALGLVSLLGDRLPEAIAVVLVPEGVVLKDKDISALAEDIGFEIEPDTAIEVVENFFDLNPLSLILQKLSGMAEKIAGKIVATSSVTSSASSPGETLPDGTKSYGDTPTKSASPISATGSEKSSSERQ